MRVSIRPAPLALMGRVSFYLLFAAWLYANISSLQWLFESLRQISLLNLVAIGCIAIAFLVRVVSSRRRAGWETYAYLLTNTPVLRLYPLLLMVGSAISAIALRWWLDIEQLTILLFLLGTYGLFGLVIAPAIWRKGFPLVSLIACLIAFSSQVGIGLGLPTRVLTAHAVEHLLSSWQIAAISSYDIIILENGIAQVDLPCSGLKSLGTGTLFLFAATWLESRKIGIRWLLVCLTNCFLLLCTNTIRVLLLVLITYVLKQPQFAQILHIPLGLMGLGCACGLSWLMLQTVPKQEETRKVRQPEELEKLSSSTSIPAQALLLAFILALAPINQLYHPPIASPISLSGLQWPEQMVAEPIKLSPSEQRFFSNNPKIASEKIRFELGNMSGSILVVANTTWRTYHPPEVCLLGTGLKVEQMEPKRLTSDVKARWLSLSKGKYSATYWFQSPTETTDDFLSRLWSEVTHHQKNWVLISVLFDGAMNPESSEIQKFTTLVHDAINQNL